MPSDENTPETPTSAADSRKSNKPIMEKRRRARINASLSELKSLLLEVMKKEGTRHHKMEKADILEMTVKHLRQIQRQNVHTMNNDPVLATKYSAGYNECATEVSRYLSTVEDVDVNLRTRVLEHLANSVTSQVEPATQQIGLNPITGLTRPLHIQTVNAAATGGASPVPIRPAPITILSPDINNNNVINLNNGLPVIQSTQVKPSNERIVGVADNKNTVQVIPSQLPNGEIALVIPSNLTSNTSLPSYVIPIYPQASSITTQPKTMFSMSQATPPTHHVTMSRTSPSQESSPNQPSPITIVPKMSPRSVQSPGDIHPPTTTIEVSPLSACSPGSSTTGSEVSPSLLAREPISESLNSRHSRDRHLSPPSRHYQATHVIDARPNRSGYPYGHRYVQEDLAIDLSNKTSDRIPDDSSTKSDDSGPVWRPF